MEVEQDKKILSEKKFYPVLFMMLISAFFIGVLAIFYFTTKTRVEQYREQKFKSVVLSLFSINYTDIDKDFSAHITEERGIDDYLYYRAEVENEVLGYAFPLYGNGLWGKIEAIIALNAKLEKIINFEILEQNETPGLGGRITERRFKDQFMDKKIRDGIILRRFSLISENEKAGEFEVNQITGATSSSNAVVNMIYDNLKTFLDKLEGEI